jgi:hypothetical protein
VHLKCVGSLAGRVEKTSKESVAREEEKAVWEARMILGKS